MERGHEATSEKPHNGDSNTLPTPSEMKLPTHSATSRTMSSASKHRKFWLWTIVLSIFIVLFTTAKTPDSFTLDVSSSFPDESSVDITAAPPTDQRGSYTDQVKFDKYSLIVNGQRIFLNSGEFHTFRLPVPSLWPDIMQKFKAAGLNSVSVYTHMGLINPSRGVVDFDGFRAFKPLFEAAQKAGIWIVLRPGPYINAETSAGGIAHWITTEVAGKLRTNATDWKEAWIPYIKGVIEETVPYQITRGGPVIAVQIDNEFRQDVGAEYYQELIDFYHDSEIVVPLTYNDPGPDRNFINGTGAVDLYGLDSYPQGFDCANPTVWKPLITTYHDYHMEVNPWQPFYVPEFQGGSFDAWGPGAPGYGACEVLTGPEFQSVFNLQLWASNAKLINYYMVYGGTSWGAIPFQGVYTSYDYAAPISEDRTLNAKFDELKRQSLFIRSSPDFYKTDRIADTSTGLNASTNPDVFVTYLKNPDTQAGFYIVRQRDSTLTTPATFKLDLEAKGGSLRIPLVNSDISLNGRQSKVIVTSYTFGKHGKVVYSTAQVFYAGVIDGRDVLFLHGDPANEHETTLFLTGKPNTARTQSSNVRIASTDRVAGATVVAFLPGLEGLVTVYDSDTQLVLYADSRTAATFWSPTLAGKSSDPLREFWSYGTNSSILVGGPYLVRSADIKGHNLALTGDLNATAFLTVIAPERVKTITWNGEPIESDRARTMELDTKGVFVGRLGGVEDKFDGISIPRLEGWKFTDSLPEANIAYNDSHWVLANHTTTNIPLKPRYGNKILYGCDYGFCEGVVLWRGHFNATGNEEHFRLFINGGGAFAASVWINDVFIRTTYGNSTNNKNIIEENDDPYDFPAGSVVGGRDNVVTVVQDNTGLDESRGENTGSMKSPRGVRGFSMEGNEFLEWRVQGKVGGYLGYPDKLRGVFNEGGLFGERKGWHLPGFDTSSWSYRELSYGLPNDKAGVGWFVTTFDLDLPKGYDTPLSFTFNDALGQPYRALLFVNGWMMGKRVANLGPQFKFPVHQGILNFKGRNTVAVALWAMESTPISPQLELTLDATIAGGPGEIKVDNPTWSSKGRELD